MHIGFDRFQRIVFAGRHLFERGSVHDDIHALHGAAQTIDIAHVANQVAQLPFAKFLPHLVLFQFIAAIHPDDFGMVFFQHHFAKVLAKRTGSAGDQDGLLTPINVGAHA
jgi:hypothetical protein